jgi:2-(1,2-epoxy-1,2-dihydrophenyl)acetyl-CoA isomerase
MSRESFVDYSKDGAIVTVCLKRPDARNALGDLEDCRDLIAAFERAEVDPAVSVLILTGSGTAFSAGGNLKNMREGVGLGRQGTPLATRAHYRGGVQQIALTMTRLEIATIAAVNGPAVGLGCDLACFCDLRVAADTARFASSFTNIGLVPGDGGAWALQKVIGYANAAEMILTGDTYSAEQAREMGLVNRVVPADKLMAEARALAERISAHAPQSTRLSKRLLREAQHGRLGDVLELSAAYQALAHETADHAEALAAFFEKRPPRYQGN